MPVAKNTGGGVPGAEASAWMVGGRDGECREEGGVDWDEHRNLAFLCGASGRGGGPRRYRRRAVAAPPTRTCRRANVGLPGGREGDDLGGPLLGRRTAPRPPSWAGASPGRRRTDRLFGGVVELVVKAI